MKDGFTEQDKNKTIAFLNHIAKHATLTQNVNESIEFFRLLSFMQQDLIPKIDRHILEIKNVVTPSKDDF